MVKMTKVELEQRLDAALKDNEALRLEVAQLKATLEVRTRAAASGTKVRSVAAPTPSADQLAYRAYIADAREQALRSGCSVQVLSFAAWMAAGEAQAA